MNTNTHVHHIYLRVSRDSQDNANQEHGVLQWLEQRSITNFRTYKEHVSSVKPWRERALQTIMGEAVTGDVIVAAEFSRIGRNTTDVLDFFAAASRAGVGVVITKTNFVLSTDITGRILAVVMALASEIELAFTRARTQESLDRQAAELAEKGYFTTRNGTRRTSFGRPTGTLGESKLLEHAADIDRLLSAKTSYRAIARLLKCHPSTVRAYALIHYKTPEKK